GHVDVGGATGVDDLALGVIDNLLALEGVALLDDLGLVDQDDAFVGGEILDGQAVSLDDLLVDRRLLLVVGGLADGGEDLDIAIAVLGDGHRVAGDLHRALGDHHVAAVDRNALAIVQFGGVCLDPDRLVAIFRKGVGVAAEQENAQTEQEWESLNAAHAGLLRWIAGASCLRSG